VIVRLFSLFSPSASLWWVDSDHGIGSVLKIELHLNAFLGSTFPSTTPILFAVFLSTSGYKITRTATPCDWVDSYLSGWVDSTWSISQFHLTV
jgi:hypothetical protein